MGCLFGLLDILFIRSLVWVFKWMVGTAKYMGMAVVAIFVGPLKTVHRLAASNTERQTGLPWDQTPRLYKVEKTKVVLWMLWAYAFWGYLIYNGYMSTYGTP